MLFNNNTCSSCHSSEIEEYKRYNTKSNGENILYICRNCSYTFSETSNTFLFRLRKPIWLVVLVMKSLTEGMGINACQRTFNISKNTIYLWLEKFSEVKKVLYLYSLCNQFIDTVVEGDELYTRVKKNVPQEDSLGWTIVFIERRTRFIWHMQCGKKDKQLFKDAMRILYDVVKQSEDFKLFTDGERRYANLLFEICYELIYTGRRPKKTFEKGVKVRVKNKGSQAHKKGPKRKKYQQPKNEHPENIDDINDKDIHANHTEAFNAALRRKCSAYRRRCNTYAKEQYRLQQRLDLHWVRNNFIEKHYTTGQVPAVAINIMQHGLTFEEIFFMKIKAQ